MNPADPFSTHSDYPAQSMNALEELVLDAHELARGLVAERDAGAYAGAGVFADVGAGAKPVNVYVYGALAPGWVAARALAEYPQLRVCGFIDRDGERLRRFGALGLHSCGAPDGLSIFSLDAVALPSAAVALPQVVVVAVAPVHHEAVARVLAEQLPEARVAYLHRSAVAAPLRQPRVPFLVTTPGRCGTLWLTRMLGALVRETGYRQVSAGDPFARERTVDQGVVERLVPGRFCVDHVSPTPMLISRIAENNLHAAHLFRDPRDMQVSASFYNRGEFRYDFEYLEKKIEQIEAWHRVPGVLQVRYEELRADTVATLARVLEHVGMCEQTGERAVAEPDRIREVAELFGFAHLSGGRSPGQEDPASHYRKGVCGDWKNHYSWAEAVETRTRLGERIAALGYEA